LFKRNTTNLQRFPLNRLKLSLPKQRLTRSAPMIGFLLRLAAVAAGLWLAARIVPGIHVRSLETLALAALLLGVINAFVRPVLIMLTLPLTLITLGLFLLVINAAMLWLVSVVLEGFEVHGFLAAFWGAIVVGLVSWFASGFIGAAGKVELIKRRRRRR